jgi:hypothetical protein
MTRKIIWYGKEVINKINTANKKIMSTACLLVERDAKKLCPVDT